MKKVAVTGTKQDEERPERWLLTDAIGSTDVSINYYELGTGDTFGGGYHAHHDQEEIFYVQSGAATFETEDGDVVVSAGEIIRFAPGEFHCGYNGGDDTVVALGFGAPPNSTDVELYTECLECETVFTHHRASIIGETNISQQPAVACPECGGETQRIHRPTSV